MKRKGIYLEWGLGLISLLIGALYLQEILFAPINTDAGFYLSIAKLLQSGSTIYTDIKMSYTPLGVSFFALWGNIFGTGYNSYLSSIAIIQFINAVWLFLISRQIGARLPIAWLASLTFLFLSYKYEGLCIVLEPFVVFWLLGATWAFFNPKPGILMPLFAGICTSMAILSKQYAFAFLPILTFYLIWGDQKHKRWYSILGLMIPWVCCFAWFSAFADLSPQNLWEIWMNNDSYGERSVSKAIKAFLFFLLIALPHIFAVPFTKDFIAINQLYFRKLFKIGALSLAFLGLGVSLYIEQYPHYFLLIIPFGILLGVYMWVSVKGELDEWLSFLNTSFANKVVLIGLALTLMVVSLRFVRTIPGLLSANDKARKAQISISEEVKRHVPPESEVLLLSYYSQWLNYTNSYQPVLPKTYGYAFPENQSDDQLAELIQAATIILTESYDLEQYPRYQQLMEQFSFRKTAQTSSGIQVWKKASD